MNKYKRGDKLWFEIVDVVTTGSGRTLYLCSNGGYVKEETLDAYNRLKPEEQAKLDYRAGYAEGYAAGLSELWVAIKIGLGMTAQDRREYLGYTDLGEAYRAKGTPEDFILRIRKFEEKAEIKVGDEVEIGGVTRFFVTRIYDEQVCGTDADGKWCKCHKKEARKTGRHFREIAGVLEQMKEE